MQSARVIAEVGNARGRRFDRVARVEQHLSRVPAALEQLVADAVGDTRRDCTRPGSHRPRLEVDGHLLLGIECY